MGPHRDLVRQAVENPVEVRWDQTKHRNEVFYRRWQLRRRGPRSWLKVVVRFTTDPLTNRQSGEVLTAYPMRRPKPGEVRRWP
jgi:transposase